MVNDGITEEHEGSKLEMESTQSSQETGKEKPCPLCTIPRDEVLMEFPRWRLARTKTMKGHKERVMIYYKDHAKILDEQSVGEAHMILLTVGQKFFSYTKQWGIFEPVYATVPEHWHRVASDLDPSSEDYEQILKTPRLIIDTDRMTIDRVKPEPPKMLPGDAVSTDHPADSSTRLPFKSSKQADNPNAWRGSTQ
jgi:hypothetical protein